MIEIIRDTRDNLIKIRSYVESLDDEAECTFPTIKEESGFISDLINELRENLVASI